MLWKTSLKWTLAPLSLATATNSLLQTSSEDVNVEDDTTTQPLQNDPQYTDLLDTNYAAGFKDFRMDAMENFPEADFSSIKLNLVAATNSLL